VGSMLQWVTLSCSEFQCDYGVATIAACCSMLQWVTLSCSEFQCDYGVATISRLLKIIELFCRILSLLLVSFAKETYNFKEPTSRSHPIA